MKNNYKVVAVTPAGRQRYLEILYRYICKNKHILDRWDIWVNTPHQSDIDYLKNLAANDPFVNLIFPEWLYEQTLSITPFWTKATDEDTVYVRFDDDVVFIADNTIENLVQFRLNNPEYFLIYPFIINSTQHSRNLQDRGLISTQYGLVRQEEELFGQGIYDPVGLYSVEFARHLHDTFLSKYSNNTYKELMTPEKIVWKLNSQVSINCVCWTGEFMKKISPLNHGILPTAEEAYLTIDGPKELNMHNCTIPDTLIVHFLFSTQRPKDEMYDVLEMYNKIANE
jgi:hypothetical protein